MANNLANSNLRRPDNCPNPFLDQRCGPIKKKNMQYVSVSIRMHWRHSSQWNSTDTYICVCIYIYIFVYIYIYV